MTYFLLEKASFFFFLFFFLLSSSSSVSLRIKNKSAISKAHFVFFTLKENDYKHESFSEEVVVDYFLNTSSEAIRTPNLIGS